MGTELVSGSERVKEEKVRTFCGFSSFLTTIVFWLAEALAFFLGGRSASFSSRAGTLEIEIRKERWMRSGPDVPAHATVRIVTRLLLLFRREGGGFLALLVGRLGLCNVEARGLSEFGVGRRRVARKVVVEFEGRRRL
jgi:hypothetical protein